MRTELNASAGPVRLRAAVRALGDRIAALSPTTLALGLIALGTALRLNPWFFGRPLWGDEARLAINFVERDFAGLLQPLRHSQGAPVLYLLATELATQVLGLSELSLRLIPALAGIASLPAYFLVVRTLAGTPTALLALAFLACSWPAIRYSSEVKQYSADLLVAVLLLALVGGLHAQPLTWRRMALLAVVGAGLIWASHPAIFMLGGATGAALLCSLGVRAWSQALRIVALAATWVLSFAGTYLATVRKIQGQAEMTSSWELASWAPLVPSSPTDALWYPSALVSMMEYPGGFGFRPLAVLAGGIVVVGGMALWRTRRSLLGYLVLPATLAVVASGLHAYPFSHRALLFLLPAVFLLLAVGVATVAGLVARRGATEVYRWLAAGLVTALLVGWFLPIAAIPRDIPGDMDDIWPRVGPNDAVYFPGGWASVEETYAHLHGVGRDKWLGDVPSSKEWAIGPQDVAPWSRVWVPLTGPRDDVLRDMEELGGRLVEAHRVPSGTIYLYEFRGPTTDARQ